MTYKTNDLGFITPPELDERDTAILAERTATLNEVEGPRVGDWVRFADGTERRISYIWSWDDKQQSIQTSAGGSYYLGNGYVSMSGSLYQGIKPETLTLTDELKDGNVWFFHHDWHRAGGAVHATVPFRVFTCTEQPTT